MGFWKMAAGGAVILGLLENFRELHGFRTTEYDIRSEKIRGEARVPCCMGSLYGQDSRL